MNTQMLVWTTIIYIISAVAFPTQKTNSKSADEDSHHDKHRHSAGCKAHPKTAHFQLKGTSDFGQLKLGDMLTKDFTLINDGDKKAKDISFSLDRQDFSLASTSCSFSKIKRQEFCQIAFAFQPTSAGPAFATVTMNYKSRGKHATQSFFLTGEGIALPTPPVPSPTPIPEPSPVVPPPADSDARIDEGFGDLGWVTTILEGGRLSSVDSIPSNDGGVIVLGRFIHDDGVVENVVLRYTATGGLDDSFGTGGVILLGSPYVDTFNKIIEDPAGGILLAGSRLQDGDKDVLLARLTLQGEIDVSFGVGGLTTVDLGYGDDVALDMILQPDGKIVLAGYGNIEGNEDMLILRFLSNGDLDSRFNGSGISAADFWYGNDRILAMALDSQNRIVVAGKSDSGGVSRVALVRFTSTGQYDNSFGTQGQYLGDQGEVKQVFVLPSGAIRLAGSINLPEGNTAALWQLETTGQADTSFNGDGLMTFTGISNWQAAELLSNGNMVLTGISNGDLVAYLLDVNGDSVWPERIVFDGVVAEEGTGSLAATTDGLGGYVVGTKIVDGITGVFIVKLLTQ